MCRSTICNNLLDFAFSSYGRSTTFYRKNSDNLIMLFALYINEAKHDHPIACPMATISQFFFHLNCFIARHINKENAKRCCIFI